MNTLESSLLRAAQGQGWPLRCTILVNAHQTGGTAARLGRWLLTTAMAASAYACSYSGRIGGSINSNVSGSVSHSSSGGGLIVMGFGLLMLYGGFQNYRKLRLLGASPIIPIRSVAAGLVHILGNAVGENRLTSPLTRQPCFYFQVMVEKWQRGRNSQWSMCLRHTDHTKFYLQDATGKVLVDLHQAQLDLPQTFRKEIMPAADAVSANASGLSDRELWDYVVRTNGQIQTEIASRGEPVIHAIAQTECSVSLMPADLSALDGGLRLRVTETCLLAGRDCNILGTCLDNPNSGDANDGKLIGRGPNKSTFVISSKVEPELEAQTKRGSYTLLALGGLVLLIGVALFFA